MKLSLFITLCALVAYTAGYKAISWHNRFDDESMGGGMMGGGGGGGMEGGMMGGGMMEGGYWHIPNYKYDYGVEDHHTGDHKKAWEMRHGDMVKGGYMLHEPDGTKRVVEYVSDKMGGFQAHVKQIGIAHHPQIYGIGGGMMGGMGGGMMGGMGGGGGGGGM